MRKRERCTVSVTAESSAATEESSPDIVPTLGDPVPDSLRAVISVRDDLRALEGYHSPQVAVRVRLNTNESPFPPPKEWSEEFAAALSSIDWHRYPDRGAVALRTAIAEFHGVQPANVFVANGSNEVLQTLLLAYGGPGRTVATFEPTYQLHAHIARVTGARVVEGERDPDFRLGRAEMRRVLETFAPEVTFLCSPNNPTGVVESSALVTELIDLAPGLVIIDEAYAQFADWSALELVNEDRPMVVVRTFSKTWGMAAARLGYLIGPTWLVAELDKVVLPYHLDAAKQLAGTLALRHVSAMDERVRFIVAERERLASGLAAHEIDVIPSGANFILFRPRQISGRALWEGLLEQSVLVRDCSGWPRLTDCLRVTVGTEEENTAFLEAVASVLSASSPVLSIPES
jgi:histidinol-phosphate aminotransferase